MPALNEVKFDFLIKVFPTKFVHSKGQFPYFQLKSDL